MSQAVRSRSSAGSRNPGLIDSKAVASPDRVFNNKFSLNTSLNTSGVVAGPTMATAASNAGISWAPNIITVAMWFKFDNTGSQSEPDGFDGLANASNDWNSLSEGWGLYWNSNSTVGAFTNTFGNLVVSQTLIPTNWNFLVFTWDVANAGGTRLKMYSNGNNFNQGSSDGTGFTDNLNRNIEVGRTGNTMGGSGATDYTPGYYKEFAIWNTELSGNAIETLYNGGLGPTAANNYGKNSGSYNQADNLVLWWRLGDGGDQIDVADGIIDQSGNGNHGTSSDMVKAEDIPGA